MNNLMSYTIVALLVIGFIYVLVRQIKHIMSLRKNRSFSYSKRLLLSIYLTIIAIAGFLISFLLNVAIFMQVFQSNALTSNNTAIACFLFIFILLMAKYVILPKNQSN
ncbi:hypothetical protein [Pontibacillus litoralis]|uniref:Uncharacterized protein n=1 Tax=Pontibacillus litoralis JSM 072002 TaxID=1385512 RepID=A0A0A5G2T9_9BACI|nr:hypothetical protein [Pontibacillus litoralis]KGX87406.1 hypothetical protein N784_15860 [Pontibacillus litoralis JSM 072002]